MIYQMYENNYLVIFPGLLLCSGIVVGFGLALALTTGLNTTRSVNTSNESRRIKRLTLAAVDGAGVEVVFPALKISRVFLVVAEMV
jgi:hypothetical protein